ncbi:hypothetical protein DESC_70007 [Desulfosarcina cetonica]|nr:hypothetical protein DESC_70007 [Desulfosarcina cetonica]
MPDPIGARFGKSIAIGVPADQQSSGGATEAASVGLRDSDGKPQAITNTTKMKECR